MNLLPLKKVFEISIPVYLILLSFTLIIFSCTNNNDQDDSVFIRVKNVSQYEFTDVEINTSGGINNYGRIAIANSSDYKSFDFAYSYAKIEVTVQGKLLVLQPIDYVGEQKIAPGNYTYKINANLDGDEFHKLSFVLVKDE